MKGRSVQHGWEAVRSQILAQMARREPAADEHALSCEDRRIFRIDDAEPYYGPTRAAREAVSRLLGLAPGAGQTEWEAELASGRRLGSLVDALADCSLDTEARTAVALLLLDYLQRTGGRSTELLARIRWQMRADPRVQSRMRYWWTHMDGCASVMEALS
jgi:hypothetical protein